MDIKKAVKRATEYKDAGKRIPWKQIAEEFGFGWQVLRSRARREWQQHGTEDSGVAYQVINGVYNWETGYGVVQLPVEQVDQMFFEFSRHGMNKSSQQIVSDWNMEWWQWHSLKSRLRLYKDSNIFSPHTVSITPKVELARMIEAKMSELYEKTSLIVERQYNKQTLKEARRIIERKQLRDHITADIIEHLHETIEINSFPVYQIDPPSTKQRETGCVIAFGDLHLGLVSDGLDEDVIRERIDQIAEVFTSRAFSEVKVVILGDLIESFTGMTKGDTWQNLSVIGYGADIILTAVDVLAQLIAKISAYCPKVEVYAIPGNHDRMTNNKDEDPIGQIGMLIYKLAEKATPGVDWRIAPICQSFEHNETEFIVMHGDKAMSKLSGAEIAMKYGKTDRFKVILRGHYHHRQILEDTTDYRYITIPSIVGETPFSKRLGAASRPGFVMFLGNTNTTFIDL